MFFNIGTVKPICLLNCLNSKQNDLNPDQNKILLPILLEGKSFKYTHKLCTHMGTRTHIVPPPPPPMPTVPLNVIPAQWEHNHPDTPEHTRITTGMYDFIHIVE